MTKLVLVVVCVMLATPALLIGGFNTLNEAGQWGLAAMPHNFETYGAVLAILSILSVRINYKKEEKPTIVVLKE